MLNLQQDSVTNGPTSFKFKVNYAYCYDIIFQAPYPYLKVSHLSFPAENELWLRYTAF